LQFSEKEDSYDLITGENGNLADITELLIKRSGKILSLDELWKMTFADKAEIRKILLKGAEEGSLVWLMETEKILSKALYSEYIVKVNNEFRALNIKYPYRYQIDREEIKSRVFSDLESKDFTAILNKLKLDGHFWMDGNSILRPEDIDIKRITSMKDTQLIEKILLEDGLNPGSVQQLKQAACMTAGARVRSGARMPARRTMRDSGTRSIPNSHARRR
jgi:selenocysteine-specific elongation factor